MLLQRWLINLVLLGLVLVLALAVRLELRQATLATRLTPLLAEEVKDIRLQRAGQPALHLVRDGDRWRMLEPFTAEADQVMLDKLLPIVAATTERTLPAAALDLPRLGLDPAPIRLWLDDLELRVGGTEPIAEQRYVQVGDSVYLTDNRFLPPLLAAAEDYVDKRLLPSGFSPGIGSIDGRPLTADTLAVLADSTAQRVEPLTGQLSGHVLSIESADGGPGLRFLVADGGTRWSRLDQHLSYVFAAPPLAEADEDMAPAAGEPMAPAPFTPAAAIPDDPGNQQEASPAELLELRPPDSDLLPPAADAPMPTEKRSP
jgi:hypothetical protein